ncbi:hypothetical protein [Lysobacter arvi]|uniref:MFS transporter n=1 Tax=Lysobacter arvi TaxID=3038776 RepID=A0ABU1CE31_9GAMM|nr:hypothetical protein [Lysobacter arvi]MDR0183400.1 hypothetical protein [Lysobacter arvi]
MAHLLTLGVIGNAMLGALTQFLPVAIASRFAGIRAVPALHASFNAGLLAFAFSIAHMARTLMQIAAVLLGGSLAMFAALACLSLWRGTGARWPRAGIGVSMCALAITALLGAVALQALGGRVTVDLGMLVDVHASFGVIGAVLALVASVGAVTLPMLQGTPGPQRWMLPAWLCLIVAGLLGGAWQRTGGDGTALLFTAATATYSLVAASVWLQIKGRLRRNPTLAVFWALGTIALGLAAAGMTSPLPAGIDRAMLVGTLALAIALPWLVVGMMLEIVGFLAWIHLRAAVPRGRRVPGVGALMPERDKRVVLCGHLSSAVALLVAVSSNQWHAVAGLAFAAAWIVTLLALLRCGGRVRDARRDAARP